MAHVIQRKEVNTNESHSIYIHLLNWCLDTAFINSHYRRLAKEMTEPNFETCAQVEDRGLEVPFDMVVRIMEIIAESEGRDEI